jgi:L-arabinokinase
VTDPLAWIDPHCEYAVRSPTAHPIYEHQRVRLFQALLQARQLEAEALDLLGELMFQSHVSYRHCGLHAAGADPFVQRVRGARGDHTLYGARMTGPGEGPIAVLAGLHAYSELRSIVEELAARTGRTPEVFGGSSPGAVQYGLSRLAAR